MSYLSHGIYHVSHMPKARFQVERAPYFRVIYHMLMRANIRLVNNIFPGGGKTSDSITNIVAFTCHSLPIAAQ